MRIFKNSLFLFTVMLSICSCNMFNKTPGPGDVRKAAGDMIKALEKSANEEPTNIFRLNNFLRRGFSKIFDIRNISAALIILIVTSSVLTLVYFVAERVSFNFYRAGGAVREEVESEKSFRENILDGYIRDNNYSAAVLYIYRYSIIELKEMGFSVNPGMTNLMLYGMIKKENLRNAFRKIYLNAEEVLFSGRKISFKEFTDCSESFALLRGYK